MENTEPDSQSSYKRADVVTMISSFKLIHESNIPILKNISRKNFGNGFIRPPPPSGKSQNVGEISVVKDIEGLASPIAGVRGSTGGPPFIIFYYISNVLISIYI